MRKLKYHPLSPLCLLFAGLSLHTASVEAVGTITNSSFTPDPSSGNIFDPNLTDLSINSGTYTYFGSNLANNAGTFTVNGGDFDFFQDIIASGCGDVAINGGSFSLYQTNLGQNCKSLYISPNSHFNITNGYIGSGCGTITIENASITHTGLTLTSGGSDSIIQSGPINISNSFIRNINNSSFIRSVFDSVTINDSEIFNGTTCNCLSIGQTWGRIPITLNNSTITNFEVFGKDLGQVNIDSCYLDNSHNKQMLLNTDTIYITGSSTILNTGNFGQGCHGITLSGASVSNTYKTIGGTPYGAEFAIGMSFEGAINPHEKGTIELAGNTYFYNSGRLGAGNGVFKITNANLINDNGQVALGMSEVYVLGGTISNYGEIGRGCQEIQISGGSISNDGSFASLTQDITISGSAVFYNEENGVLSWNTFPYLNLSGGTVINAGLIGPTAIKLNGAQVVNNGEIFCGQTIHAVSSGMSGNYLFPSYTVGGAYSSQYSEAYPAESSFFSSGSLTGTGELFITGTTTITMPIEQGTVTVGYIYSPRGPSNGTLIFTDEIKADFILSSLGKCYTTGTVIGDVYLSPNSNLSPGGLLDPSQVFNVVGNVYPVFDSVITLDFDASGSDAVYIDQGNLVIGQGAILRLTAKGNYSPPTGLVLFSVNSSSVVSNEVLPSNYADQQQFEQIQGAISGKFIIEGDQALVNLNLIYTPTEIILNADYNSFTIIAQNQNQAAIGTALDQLTFNTNPCLQSKINEMYLLPGSVLEDIFYTLDPSEFKGQQLVMEELVFSVNDSIRKELFDHNKKFKSSVAGAFRYMNENSYSQYNGFHANTGYEYLTTSYGWDKTQILGAVGGMQTATRYKRKTAQTSSNSIFTALGLTGFHKNFSFGADILFAYNFISTERKLDYFIAKPKSYHGGYSTKISVGLKYAKNFSNSTLTPYDFISYQSSHENVFKELDGECLGMEFKSHNRQVIRNALGLNFEMLKQKKVSPYIDLAYVYENRYSGNHYKCRFENTNTWFTIEGLNPSSNFLKYELGIVSNLEKWNFRMNVNGLYSSKLQEYEAFLSASRKF